MSTSTNSNTLALNGGPQACSEPVPPRKHFGQEERQAVLDLFDQAMTEGANAMGYGGPQEDAYCQAFAESLGGGYADGVNSGTNAVFVALAATNPKPFSEVIVPPISDPGGVMPVAMLNCIPVAADTEPNSFNIGPEQIEAVITDRTSAIIVAHIGGIPADMEPIMDLAHRHGIAVVEDCAQSHGAVYKGQPVGTLGDTAAFSTMFGKHHASAGQGGLVFTRSEERYWQARRWADRGKPFNIENPQGNVIASLNCNMDEIHAAIGLANLRKLPGFVQNRRRIAQIVADGCTSKLSAISMWTERPEDHASYWFLTFDVDYSRLTADRDTLVQALHAEGCLVAAGYPFYPLAMPWATQRCVACGQTSPCDRTGCPAGTPPNNDWPNARAFEGRVMRLPIHEGWTELHAQQVVAALAKVEAAYKK